MPAWAASVGEVRIGEESNPTISIQLSGVDTEGIIEQARREDNQGNRSRCVRQMLFTQLGIEGEGEFEQHKDFLWRNTRRRCVVLFQNIRELSDSSLDNPDESWKLIIDFPFDEQGHGPRDDINQIQTFEQSHPRGTKTLCWIPAFLSVDAQKDLGMLVILEHVLAGSRDGFMGERFVQYSGHLSIQDRQSAKSLLENHAAFSVSVCRAIWTRPMDWIRSCQARWTVRLTWSSMSGSHPYGRVSNRNRPWHPTLDRR